MNVIITGSARGLGFEMAKQFRSRGFSVAISDINEENLKKAEQELEKIVSGGKIISCRCDVTNLEDLENLWNTAYEALGEIDLWINNAGVNQPMVPLWELKKEEIELLLNIDLKGAMLGSKVAISHMKEQQHGCVYCIEGFGADNATQLGLTAYGAAKKGVQYMVRGLAKELEKTNTPVQVGRLNPGIMITDFITHPLGQDGTMELTDATKKVYNILGDTPDVVAAFLVSGMIRNISAKKQDDYVAWLTKRKAAWRFMSAGFNKRDFFRD